MGLGLLGSWRPKALKGLRVWGLGFRVEDFELQSLGF